MYFLAPIPCRGVFMGGYVRLIMSVISEDAIALGHNSQLSPLDVPTAIWQRQSIRHFAPDPIAPSLLKQLIELTVAARFFDYRQKVNN